MKMINKEILEERERIKAIIQRKIEGVEIICSERKTKRGKHSIGKIQVIRGFEDVLFLIDNPESTSTS